MPTKIDFLLKECISLRVSDAWRGEKAAIFLELGHLHKNRGNRQHTSKGQGDVTLMFDCRWRLETKGSVLVGSLNEYATIENHLKQLVGHSVKSISFIGRIPELVVEFNKDRWLQSFTSYRSEDWGIIFHNKGSIGRSRGRVVYDRRAR